MRTVLLLLASTAARRRGGPPPLRPKNKGTGLTGGGPARRRGGAHPLRHKSNGRARPLRHQSRGGIDLTGGGPLIDGDGFLRDLLPVLDYDESQENVTTKTPTRGRARGYLRARQVPGDGACLFHTLSAGLWESVNGTHHPMDRKVLRSQSLRLRARAIDVLEDRRDPKLYMGDNEYMKASQLLEMAAEQAACAKDEYCAKLRDPRAWGGGPEIVALSNALSRPIHIYELVWASADAPCARKNLRGGAADGAPNAPRWCVQCIAEFGTPKWSRRYPPIHVLSCDSRFPHLQPEQQLEQGNHFLLLFECDPQEAREAALEAGADDRAADLVFAECARRRVQKAKAVTADRDVTWAPYYDPSKPPRRRFGVSPLLVGALGVVAKLRFGL